jgi:hypothetical protein
VASVRIPKLFNGPIEVGLRSLVVLLEAYPEGLDLQRLVIFDYLLIHSGDITGGPASIHPPSPLRAGEVAIRRGLIEHGLNLYACRGLVARQLAREGILYVAEETASIFVDAMNSGYVRDLRERAEWLFGEFGLLADKDLEAILNESMGRWRTEFAFLEVEEDDV